MNIVALDLETFMNLTRPPPPLPTEPFRWRDQTGNLHAPATLATRQVKTQTTLPEVPQC